MDPRIFNKAGVKRAGLDFDEFLDACLAIGALGVVIDDDAQDRDAERRFCTRCSEVRPVEDQDQVCVHPLFVSLLFDQHAVAAMAKQGKRAIYPYGSDPEHVGHDV